MEVAFDETTKEVLFDAATGAVREDCCMEYGNNCSCWGAGLTPKYISITITGFIVCRLTGACANCTNVNGTYIVEQKAGYPCWYWRQDSIYILVRFNAPAHFLILHFQPKCGHSQVEGDFTACQLDFDIVIDGSCPNSCEAGTVHVHIEGVGCP